MFLASDKEILTMKNYIEIINKMKDKKEEIFESYCKQVSAASTCSNYITVYIDLYTTELNSYEFVTDREWVDCDGLFEFCRFYPSNRKHQRRVSKIKEDKEEIRNFEEYFDDLICSLEYFQKMNESQY